MGFKWKNCLLVDAGAMEYKKAYELQLKIVDGKWKGVIKDDITLFLEHHPVFTLGRRGGRKNLIVSETFLKEQKISIVHVERGGDITYHGPGQLVCYPIINLQKACLKVVDYVRNLEEVMIRIASKYKILAKRNSKNHGIWVNKKKLGSVGISIRRGISFHGFALNVNNSLEPFKWINPCGMKGVSMTSLHQEISGDVSLAETIEIAKNAMEQIFKIEFTPITATDIETIIRKTDYQD